MVRKPFQPYLRQRSLPSIKAIYNHSPASPTITKHVSEDLLYILIYLQMCRCLVHICPRVCEQAWQTEEGVTSLGIGVADVPEPPGLGAENQLSVLGKWKMCSL